MPDSGVYRSGDPGKLLARVIELTTSDVLVGVPAEKTGRQAGVITNASLAYIHEFGSPARNIPARPFLYPGVRKAKSAIAAIMRQGAKDVLAGNGSVQATLNKVGMTARNAVVEAITDPAPPFVPLKAATIRARLRRTAAGRRKLRKMGQLGAAAGYRSADMLTDWAESTVRGDLNIHPLIDTGQLRASITYVVRANPDAKRPDFTYWGYQRDYGKMVVVRKP